LRLALGRHAEDVVLIDVRRTGKTTVALCAMEQLASAGHLVFAIDAMENAPATIDLADRLRRQLAAQQGDRFGLRKGVTMRSILAHGRGLLPLLENEQLQGTLDGLIAGASKELSGIQQLVAVLDRIDEVAAASDRQAIIFVDEIQAIASWSDTAQLQSMLRARLSESGGNSSFLFAGSQPTSIQTLFKRGGALDFHGIEHKLEPISGPAWFEGLRRAFSLLASTIEDGAIDVILEASANHPLRTMLAARETHARAETLDPPGHASRGVALEAVETAKSQRLWNIEGTA
jgi:hypothetical protein